jgi:hypothetical protein
MARKLPSPIGPHEKSAQRVSAFCARKLTARQYVRGREHHAITTVAVVQKRQPGLLQKAYQAPRALVITEQPFSGMNAGPGRARAGIVAAPRPVAVLA